jgi:hypothetical protein
VQSGACSAQQGQPLPPEGQRLQGPRTTTSYVQYRGVQGRDREREGERERQKGTARRTASVPLPHIRPLSCGVGVLPATSSTLRGRAQEPHRLDGPSSLPWSTTARRHPSTEVLRSRRCTHEPSALYLPTRCPQTKTVRVGFASVEAPCPHGVSADGRVSAASGAVALTSIETRWPSLSYARGRDMARRATVLCLISRHCTVQYQTSRSAGA